MFCSNCGTKVIDGAVFCQKCGAKLIHDNREERGPVPDPIQESGEMENPSVGITSETEQKFIKEKKSVSEGEPIIASSSEPVNTATSPTEPITKTVQEADNICEDINMGINENNTKEEYWKYTTDIAVNIKSVITCVITTIITWIVLFAAICKIYSLLPYFDRKSQIINIILDFIISPIGAIYMTIIMIRTAHNIKVDELVQADIDAGRLVWVKDGKLLRAQPPTNSTDQTDQ